ncbi:MAG: cytosolic protein [Magnetococcales bacterium]|nr:cytosolic protein [Magnetococcales bacterium]
MTDHDNQSQTTEYDSPWKEILKAYFNDFLEFFLPEAHDGIDWQCAPEFLDKELDRITREAESGNRRVDLLVRVWLLDGDELWVLIHVEIQENRDPHFEERMFTCQYRAFDLYKRPVVKRPVVSLAILADEEGAWRPSAFGYQKWGSKVSFQFNAIKLLDYLSRLDLLESSTNPFAIVTLAHLTGKQTRNQPAERFQQKMRITRMLYERGFNRQQIVDLFRFIDWVLSLPEELDNQFWTNLSNFEENKKMPYITSVERIGMKKGEQKGKAEMLLELLQERFGLIPESVQKQVESAKLDDINVWARKIFKADSLQAVFH